MNDIDKIFKNGLREFEKLPGPGVWERLEVSLEKEEKKKPVWRHSIAASLLFLLVSTFFIYRYLSKTNDSVAVLKEGKIEQTDPKKRPFSRTLPSMAITKLANKEKMTREENEMRPISKKTLRNKNRVVKDLPPNDGLVEDIEILAEEYPEEKLALAEVTAESEKQEETPITITIKRSGTYSKAHHADTLGKDFFQKSRIGKVYAQVMNFKNGEKVNLEELSFSKKDKTNSEINTDN